MSKCEVCGNEYYLSFEVIDREKDMVRLGAGGLDGRRVVPLRRPLLHREDRAGGVDHAGHHLGTADVDAHRERVPPGAAAAALLGHGRQGTAVLRVSRVIEVGSGRLPGMGKRRDEPDEPTLELPSFFRRKKRRSDDTAAGSGGRGGGVLRHVTFFASCRDFLETLPNESATGRKRRLTWCG